MYKKIQSHTFTSGSGPESIGSTIFSQAGAYNVTVTDQNGLSDRASMQIIVDGSVGGNTLLIEIDIHRLID